MRKQRIRRRIYRNKYKERSGKHSNDAAAVEWGVCALYSTRLVQLLFSAVATSAGSEEKQKQSAKECSAVIVRVV